MLHGKPCRTCRTPRERRREFGRKPHTSCFRPRCQVAALLAVAFQQPALAAARRAVLEAEAASMSRMRFVAGRVAA